MQLNPSEISELIKKRIEGFETVTEARNEGTVVSLADGVVRIHGLDDVMAGEMIEFPGNTFGMALNLERDSVGAVILGNYEHITEGDTVKCTGRILEVPQGQHLPVDGVHLLEHAIEKSAAFVRRRIRINTGSGGCRCSDRGQRIGPCASGSVNSGRYAPGARRRPES